MSHFANLLSTLNRSGIKQTDPALYQVVSRIIEFLQIEDTDVDLSQLDATNLIAGTIPSGRFPIWQDWPAANPLTWSSSGVQPTLGNGSLTGKYLKYGRIVFFWIRLVAGSTTTFGTGSYIFNYPITEVATGDAVTPTAIGWLRDASTGLYYSMLGLRSAASLMQFRVTGNPSGGGWTNTFPITLANADQFHVRGWFDTST